MIRPPFAARVAAGIAVVVFEETRRLPTTAITLPMTAVSQVLQTSMRVQQTMTSLAIKGDQALAFMYPPEEQPNWAVFDEDEFDPHQLDDRYTNGPGGERVPLLPRVVDTSGDSAADADNVAGQGRFALYSTPPQTKPLPSAAIKAASAKRVAQPEIVEYLDYAKLTLAQLRARLRQLRVDELADLLVYEQATLARGPFVTMLTNRISSASAK